MPARESIHCGVRYNPRGSGFGPKPGFLDSPLPPSHAKV